MDDQKNPTEIDYERIASETHQLAIKASRELCLIRGLNPDEARPFNGIMVPNADQFFHDVCHQIQILKAIELSLAQ